MNEERLQYLLLQYSVGQTSSGEEEELSRYIAETGDASLFTYVVADLMQQFQPEQHSGETKQYDDIARQVHQVDLPAARGTVVMPPVYRANFLRRWGWVAACMILALGIGAYVWTERQQTNKPAVITGESNKVLPGRSGAVLTLADGSQVVLDSLGNGMVAAQDGSQVIIKNGELVYHSNGAAGKEMMYNKMSTPKGRHFSLLLPDGTRVWLNAASSLRYPTAFAGKERKVELTGEAYFEVATYAAMPFRVKINEQATVEVLGTHFNVNAYENETEITTTLLEGQVRVVQSGEHAGADNSVLLKPGQQAQVPVAITLYPPLSKLPAQQIRVVNHVDTDKVIAWKNGLFNFNGLILEEVMRQLERWYDIEVIYEKGIPSVELTGEMTKGMTLNELLATLEELGVHCSLKGRTLVVRPA